MNGKNKGSRTSNSTRNILYGFGAEAVRYVLMFVTRTVFIHYLSTVFLGINGLFSDILQMLSLAELGVGNAILFSMYKPYAEHDDQKVSALLNTYRKLYTIIGVVVTAIGLLLTPFLEFFLAEVPEISNLRIIYLLYLLNTSLSYFFVYKRSVLVVDQAAHIISAIKTISIIVQSALQILVLVIFHDFLVYLVMQVICTVGNNVGVSLYVDKHYPNLKIRKDAKLDTETSKEIKKNIAGVFISKVSGVIVSSTDNLLISKFVSTIVLGLYSNYLIFVDLFKAVVTKVFESIMGSVGNLVAIESGERAYSVYKKINFVNSWFVAYCASMMFLLANDFITLWIGEKYVLEIGIVFWICLNLFMRLIRWSNSTFIDTYGLFWNVKWKAVAEAIINIVASLVFLIPLKMGVQGVLLGTFVSNILTNFWFEPYVIYKYKFKKNIIDYFLRFLSYLACTVGSVVICTLISIRIVSIGIIWFVLKAIIFTVIINLVFILVFHKTEEFDFAVNIGKRFIKRTARKG